MQSTTHAAPGRGHLSSRHERQRRARADAFSRRTSAGMSREVPVKLEDDKLELIERLVRRDRTAVSSALLAIAGIGAGAAVRGAVLAQVGAAARCAQTEGAITAQRGEQITRHLTRALEQTDLGLAA
jgi:microcompartment protein CcmK/EutM